MLDLWIAILSIKANMTKSIVFHYSYKYYSMYSIHCTKYCGAGSLMSSYISSSWAHEKSLNLDYPISFA